MANHIEHGFRALVENLSDSPLGSPSPPPCRMGSFAAARSLLDRQLDRISASSPHFQELYK